MKAEQYRARACRVLRKVPDAVESFADRAPTLLADRHHGVLLAGMVLLLELCQLDPNLIPTYRKQARSSE